MQGQHFSPGIADIDCDEQLDCTVVRDGKFCENPAVGKLQSAISELEVLHLQVVQQHNATISESGHLGAGKPRASNSTILAFSPGGAEVFCEHSLKASMSSARTLEYAGRPRINASTASLQEIQRTKALVPCSSAGGWRKKSFGSSANRT